MPQSGQSRPLQPAAKVCSFRLLQIDPLVQTKSIPVYIFSIFAAPCNFRGRHADNIFREQTWYCRPDSVERTPATTYLTSPTHTYYIHSRHRKIITCCRPNEPSNVLFTLQLSFLDLCYYDTKFWKLYSRDMVCAPSRAGIHCYGVTTEAFWSHSTWNSPLEIGHTYYILHAIV